MNTLIEDYLDNVCRHVKWKKAHQAIRVELTSHIQELQEFYIGEGCDQEAALQQAINQMGDAQEIGKKLHNTHKPQTDWLTLGILTLLLGCGIAVLINYQQMSNFFYTIGNQQVFFTVLSLAVASIFYFTDYTRLQVCSRPLYIIGLVLNIFLLLFSNSFNYWYFHIGFFTIDGSGLVLFCYLLGLSGMTYYHQPTSSATRLHFFFAAMVAVLLLAKLQLAKAFILAIVSLVQIAHAAASTPAGERSAKQPLLLCSVFTAFLLAGVLLLITLSPYQAERIAAFLHPGQDPTGSGYITEQQHIILTDSSWLQGINRETIFYPTESGSRFIVPDSHTDLVLTYIIAQFGRGATAVLCLLFSALIIKMHQLTRKVQDSYGKALCRSITTFFTAQILYNILMNLTLLPIANIGLPFISYGGTMLMLDMILMAVFLNVYRQKNLVIIQSAATRQKTEQHIFPRIDVKITWK